MNLRDKTVNFLGDSITEGHGVAEPENIFWNVIARRSGAQICFPDARIHGGACLFDSIGHNQLPSIL